MSSNLDAKDNPAELKPALTYLREIVRITSGALCVLHAARAANAGVDGRLREAFDGLGEVTAAEYEDPTDYLMGHFFVAVISAFELFLQDYLYLLIRKYPMRLGSTQFKLSEILDAAGPDSLVHRAAEQLLHEVMYRKPLDYLRDVCEILSIDQSSLKERWKVFVEAKARRDLGIHNAWRCNATYLRKVAESGAATTRKVGDHLAPTFDDFDALQQSLRDLVHEITLLIATKHWPEHSERITKLA